jgi:hypothetical protein
MNNENGLPAEVQKFMDTHLHSEQDRRLFLDTYQKLQTEHDRANFRAAFHRAVAQGVPSANELDQAGASLDALRRSQDN